MRIVVFKTGEHTDSRGDTKTWTAGDLDRIAAGYDPKLHEAPVVIGHPKANAPAYGWVEGLKREGTELIATIKPTVESFKDWLKAGLFKKRSISLYADGTLRHIGFLGAQPPAVKGLPDFAFNEQEGVTTMEFEEISQKEREELAKKGEALPDGSFPIRNKTDLENAVHAFGRAKDKEAAKRHIIKRARALGATDMLPEDWEGSTKKERGQLNMNFWEKLKGFLKEQGVQVDDGASSFSEDQLKKAVETAVSKAKTELESEFAEKERGFAEKEAALQARETAIASRAKEAARQEVSEFCESLKKQGRLVPAMEKLGMGITGFMQAIAGIETAYEFAEAGEDGKKATERPLEFMQAFLARLPRAIEFAEVAKDEEDPGGGDMDAKRERAIRKHMDDHKMDYKDAMLAVSKKRPELFGRGK